MKKVRERPVNETTPAALASLPSVQRCQLRLVEVESASQTISEGDQRVLRSVHRMDDLSDVQVDIITGALTCSSCSCLLPNPQRDTEDDDIPD